MVNKDLVTSKLSELADRVQRVQARVPESAERLQADRDALDIVSFNLMLGVQTCADIASHIIADEGWVAATSLAQGFRRLQEHGVLSTSTAEALARAVGFRNIVAHGYVRLDVRTAFTAATSGVTDLKRFAQEVAGWLNER